jgi:translocation and assembly module TamB
MVTATGLRFANVDYGDLDCSTRYADRRARLHATLRHPGAGEVAVDGTVPVDLAWSGARADVSGEPLDLRLSASRLDVAFLPTVIPGTLRQAGGSLSADVRLSGPRRALRADGDIAFDGRLELTAAGTPYDEVRLRAAAQGQALEVTELRMRSGDGTLEGGGRIALGAGGQAEVGVRVRLEQFLAVRRPVVEAAVSGDLAVQGSLAALAIEGDLEVDRALVRPAALPSTGAPLERDPTIIIVSADGTAAQGAEPSPAPPIAEGLRLGVAVRVTRNAWIRRTDANIEIAGDVRIEKRPFEPVRLIGQIHLVRGWYEFQGRKFTVEEGTITFTGATPPEPIFDVRAVYTRAPYRITVHIEGSSQKPRLTLSSDPQLAEADILSVILFGKPTGEIGQTQSRNLQRQALQLASGYVMPELRNSVMNTLGLDALEVELPEGQGPGVVRVGRYLPGDVFVSLGQEFGGRATEVSAEYAFTPSISVRGSGSTGGKSGVEIFWRRRY